MENKKLKTCKVCGTEIAKSAKICPHCGAKLKKGHPLLIGLAVVIAFVGIAGSSGNSDEPKKVENTGAVQSEVTVTPTQKEEQTVFAVGETVELKGVSATFVGVTESEGSAFNIPSEGNVFVLCEFDIANDSNEEIVISSMLSFEAYCDDYACAYSLGALLEKGSENQLDGSVAAGKKMNGIIGYEVPADWKELEIVFTPDVWSGKDITFIANSD